MATFFSPHGFKLSKDQFISLYSEIYFYKNRNLALEKKMEKLLYCSSLSRNDIFEILCWKTGPANTDIQARTIKTQYNTIQTTPVENLLEGKKPQICEPEKAEAYFKEISKIDGIGSVYAITLLHFASCGEWPIYDKFAHLALLAIDQGREFPSIITDSELGKSFHSNAKRTFDDYLQYRKLLHTYFGDAYRKDRSIDRALWAYGHLFNENKENKNRI